METTTVQLTDPKWSGELWIGLFVSEDAARQFVTARNINPRFVTYHDAMNVRYAGGYTLEPEQVTDFDLAHWTV